MPVIWPLSDAWFIAVGHIGSGPGSPDNYIKVLRRDDARERVSKGDIHGGLPRDGWCFRGAKFSELADGQPARGLSLPGEGRPAC